MKTPPSPSNPDLVLLTPQSIEDHILPNVPESMQELIRCTVLGKTHTNLHIDTNLKRQSSLATVRYTHQSLRNLFTELRVEHNKSAPVIKRHLLILCQVFPQIFRYSQDDDGKQVLPIYKSVYNKAEVSRFFQFSVFHLKEQRRNQYGHRRKTNQPQTVTVYTKGELETNPTFVEDWMVGRRKMIGVNPERYSQQQLTDNDYFDPSAAKDADWDTLLAKPKIGRPCKPADPFNRTKTPAQRRNSLKSVAEQLNRIEATQHRIEATQQRIEQLLTSE